MFRYWAFASAIFDIYYISLWQFALDIPLFLVFFKVFSAV